MPVFSDLLIPEAGKFRRPWVLSLAVLLLGLGATWTVWNVAQKGQMQRDSGRLNRFVTRTEQGLRNRLEQYGDIARGAQGFFADEPTLHSVKEWRTYVDRLDLPHRHPGLASLAFITRVQPTDLEAFLNARPQLIGRYHRTLTHP